MASFAKKILRLQKFQINLIETLNPDPQGGSNVYSKIIESNNDPEGVALLFDPLHVALFLKPENQKVFDLEEKFSAALGK